MTVSSLHGVSNPVRLPMDRTRALTAAIALILVLLFFASLLAGRVWLSPAEIVDGLFSSRPQLSSLIVTELRLPRSVLAVLVGAT